MTTVVKNIGQLFTGEKRIERALMAIDHGKITWLGEEKNYRFSNAVEEVDAKGVFVSPGLVDCHSHAVFSGNRSNEFYERLGGVSYEDIQKRGGGIYATVEKTRAASFEELTESFKKRLDRFLSFGVTTLEVKSGYGLDDDTEEKILKVISKTAHPIERIATFLGAHVIPKDFLHCRQEYVDHVVHRQIPDIAKRKLAQFCDVFCDEHAFSVAETQQILTSAKANGLSVKIHADQLGCNDGAVLAGNMGAVSADHLEYVSDEGIQALKKNDIVAVLIPGANFSMAKSKKAPARALLEAEVKVAISCDCNPGTSCSENLPFMMSLAAIELKMQPLEIWKAVTQYAGKACGSATAGKLELGLPATFVIWDAERMEDIPYRYAACLPTATWVSGQMQEV